MEQLAIWDLEYDNCDNMVTYIFKYPYEENPYFYKALTRIANRNSSTDRESLYNKLGSCCKRIDVSEITPSLIRNANEFNKCMGQKDYEVYFLKHNGELDNPYVLEAQKQIEIRNNIAPIWMRIIVLFVGCALGAAFLMLSYLGDGTRNEIIVLLCCSCMIIAIIIIIASFVFLFNPTLFLKKD